MAQADFSDDESILIIVDDEPLQESQPDIQKSFITLPVIHSTNPDLPGNSESLSPNVIIEAKPINTCELDNHSDNHNDDGVGDDVEQCANIIIKKFLTTTKIYGFYKKMENLKFWNSNVSCNGQTFEFTYLDIICSNNAIEQKILTMLDVKSKRILQCIKNKLSPSMRSYRYHRYSCHIKLHNKKILQSNMERLPSPYFVLAPPPIAPQLPLQSVLQSALQSAPQQPYPSPIPADTTQNSSNVVPKPIIPESIIQDKSNDIPEQQDKQDSKIMVKLADFKELEKRYNTLQQQYNELSSCMQSIIDLYAKK